MRRQLSILVCFIFSLSGLCAFTCFRQAVLGKDPHACCHGKQKSAQQNPMAARSQAPAVAQHAVPAPMLQSFAVWLPETYLPAVAEATPVTYRPPSLLILRL